MLEMNAQDRPERYRKILDAVMKRDNQYFAAHPKASSYERPYVPGEAWPLDQGRRDLDRVRVFKLGPGTRSRVFFNKRGERVR